MNKIDPRALRNAFGTFMTGVTVVTAHDGNGNPLGFTANSFTSVSIEPPLVLVCMAQSSQNYDALTHAGGFAVNVLSEHQKEVSNTFSQQVKDRFAAVHWHTGPYGAPIFDGASAWFDCSMYKTVDAGDHVILIGKVEAFDASPAPGLGYVRGVYVSPAAAAEALSQNANLFVSALITRGNEVLLLDDGNGGLALPETRVDKGGATAALNRMINNSGVSAEPGFIYSVFEEETREHQHISFLCQAANGIPTQGSFTALTAATLKNVANPAVRTMLERFAAESRMGNYGIYYGNQSSGKVRPVLQGELQG